MALKKQSKKSSSFSSITLRKDLIKKLKDCHKRIVPQYTINSFYEDMLEAYEKFHCPECLNKLSPKKCSCKATERM
jgi:hypothetical protein